MANTNYENVMEILANERDMELQCAYRTKEFMNKTWNPIQLYRLWLQRRTFLDHATGIKLAMYQIRKRMGN